MPDSPLGKLAAQSVDGDKLAEENALSVSECVRIELYREANGIAALDRLQEQFYDEYPAHLHIDMLAVAQGHGFGIQMLNRLLEEIRKTSASGVHLICATSNMRARRLYEQLGFKVLKIDGDDCAMGKKF